MTHEVLRSLTSRRGVYVSGPGLSNDFSRDMQKNAEENQQLMLDFNITKIPTLMLVNSGKEVKRLEGIITMDQLKEFFGV